MQMSKEVHILKLDDILPNRFQPRIVFDENAINELTESIKEYGVIEPIIVRKVADKYEIIAGERRYKASVLAGKETIPAIITDLNDKDSAEIALIENVQRQNLTPIEEAVSYKKILDMGYMNQSELANKLGKTQSTIANKLRLLNLTDEVQEALLQERISERHARSLLRLPNNKQNDMLERIIKERMTVRKTDEEINKILAGENPTEKVIEEKVSEIPVNPFISGIKEEKEEKTMNNNDFMNQFNIPNTPIMETPKVDVAPTPVATPTVPEMPSPVSTSPFDGNIVAGPFNPTNVNPAPTVEMQEAKPVQEITPFPSENPISNGNSVKVEPQNVQTINHEIASPENEDTPISGRFFNMFGEEPVNEVENNEPINNQNIGVSPQEPTPTVTPNFDFNPFGNIETPKVDVAPTTVATPTMPEMPSPVSPLEPIPMPSVPVEPEMQSPMPEVMSPIQPFQLNDNQEFTNSSVVEMGSFGNNRMEEPTLEPLMETTGSQQKVEMKEIINMIRNCAAQIEKCGYAIDTDELDFDDNYQVIFKIEKKD